MAQVDTPNDIAPDRENLGGEEQRKLELAFERGLEDTRTLDTETVREKFQEYQEEIQQGAMIARAQFDQQFGGLNPSEGRFALSRISSGFFGYDSWENVGSLSGGGINDWIDDDTVSGGTLAGLEALTDFEVIYDPERIAEAMLRENYLPPSAFGGNRASPDYDLRERVFEFLDLPKRLGSAESPEAEKAIREALAETAGVDRDDTEEPLDRERIQELKQDYSRNDLISAASEFADLSDEMDLGTAKKHDVAEALSDKDNAAVREALDDDD